MTEIYLCTLKLVRNLSICKRTAAN